jgi:hypothetical protein
MKRCNVYNRLECNIIQFSGRSKYQRLSAGEDY